MNIFLFSHEEHINKNNRDNENDVVHVEQVVIAVFFLQMFNFSTMIVNLESNQPIYLYDEGNYLMC